MNYKEFPFVRRIVYEHRLFKQYKNEHKNESQGKYIIRNLPKTKIVSGNKKKQLLELIDSVNKTVKQKPYVNGKYAIVNGIVYKSKGGN